MDLKHVEELAKDKEITNACFCYCLSNFYKDDFKDNYEEDYDFEEIKEWKDLTDEEKETLIKKAKFYWTKDQNDTSIGRICDFVMLNQSKILQDKMDRYEFLRQICF